MQGTIKALNDEIHKGVIQSKDTRSVLARVNYILNGRLDSLEKTLTESDRQLARYVILWEYQNNGFEKYIHISEGENCEVCQNINGQVFDIDEAEIGVNFAPNRQPLIGLTTDSFSGIL